MEYVFYLTIILIIIAGYYSLFVMPKQYAFKKHQQYVLSLKVGDEVITHGGIIGTITELDEEVGVAKILIAPGVEVRIVAAALVRQYDPAEATHPGMEETEQPTA
jgi:preprotein translocase subunit YajC